VEAAIFSEMPEFICQSAQHHILKGVSSAKKKNRCEVLTGDILLYSSYSVQSVQLFFVTINSRVDCIAFNILSR